ncbi:MAG: hypothetical protein ACRDGR_01030 [bacterium]
MKLTQLTIRFGSDLSRQLHSLAKSEGLSLNQAVLRLLRRGAGLGEERAGRDRVGQSLDSLAGTWTEEEEREFLDALEPFESIDQSLWQ